MITMTNTEALQAETFFALGRRAMIRSVKREAACLIDKGPCYRQSLLCSILGCVDTYLPPASKIESSIAIEKARCDAGHWTKDGNRLIALRGHLLARRYDRRFGQ